ncbi:MAG: Stp1/IreP family PP2C-type Ser/Thr phosphatase [Acidimicrobiales bacterium]
MTTLHGGAATDVGRVRQVNEDRFLVRDDLCLYAVADGVGGHQAGEVASQTSMETLEASFVEPTTEGLVQAIMAANDAVWHLAQSASEKRGMGTTLTAVALVQEDGEEHLAVANVGDSRVYLFSRDELSQLTEDHSLVEELVREGQITKAEAHMHPQRSIITRALGMEPEIEVDHLQLLPYKGDRLLLCSDGLTNEVTDERIESTLRRFSDPADAAQELVRQARAHGGNDNITVVVVDVVDDDQRSERASAALAAEPPTSAASASPGSRALEPDPPVARAATATATAPRPVATSHRPPRRRRVTWRVLVFCVCLGLVGAVAVGAVGWYARNTYYVGLAGNQVAIYRGRPGGLLWFQPTLQERKPLTVDEVLAARLPDLRAGHSEATKADADRYVNELRQEASGLTGANTTPPPANTPSPGTTVKP